MFRTIFLLMWTFVVEESFGMSNTDLCKFSKKHQTSCNPLQLTAILFSYTCNKACDEERAPPDPSQIVDESS